MWLHCLVAIIKNIQWFPQRTFNANLAGIIK